MGVFLIFFGVVLVTIIIINSFRKSGNTTAANGSGIQPSTGDTSWSTSNDDFTHSFVTAQAASDSSFDNSGSNIDSSYDSSSYDSGSSDSSSFDSSSSDSSSCDSSSTSGSD